MSVSVGKNTVLRRAALVWVGVALFCGVFGAVYESCGHGVYSPFMVWLFVFPLLGGALPCGLTLLPGFPLPERLTRRMWGAAVANLTLGSCLTGLFEIYGSRAQLLWAYWIVGGGLLLTAAVLFAVGYVRQRR